MILLLALWEAATQPTNFLFHQPHYKPHKKGGKKENIEPRIFCKFAQFYSLFASTSLQPKPSCLSPPTATSSVCSSSSTSPGRSVQLSSAQVQLPDIETERWEKILAPRSTNWKSAESCEPPPPSPPTPSQTPPHQTSSLPLPDTPASVGSKVVPRMIWKHSWQSQRRSRRSKRRGRLRSREQLCRWRGMRSEPSGSKMHKRTWRRKEGYP